MLCVISQQQLQQMAKLLCMGTDTLRLGGVQVNDIESKLCSFLPGPLWRYPPSFFDRQGHTFLLGRLVVKSGGLVFEVVPLGYGLILMDKDSGWETEEQWSM